MATRGVYDDSLVLGSLQLPSLTAPTVGIALVKQSITPAAVAANTTVEQTFTVAGVLTGDHVVVVPPGVSAGISLFNARVSAANTVAIQYGNHTGGSLTPVAGVHLFKITR
jgi:hypothetical protein